MTRVDDKNKGQRNNKEEVTKMRSREGVVKGKKVGRIKLIDRTPHHHNKEKEEKPPIGEGGDEVLLERMRSILTKDPGKDPGRMTELEELMISRISELNQRDEVIMTIRKVMELIMRWGIEVRFPSSFTSSSGTYHRVPVPPTSLTKLSCWSEELSWLWGNIFPSQPNINQTDVIYTPGATTRGDSKVSDDKLSGQRATGLGLSYDWIKPDIKIHLATDLFYLKNHHQPNENKFHYQSFEEVRFSNQLRLDYHRIITNLISPHQRFWWMLDKLGWINHLPKINLITTIKPLSKTPTTTLIQPYASEWINRMHSIIRTRKDYKHLIKEIPTIVDPIITKITRCLGYQILKKVGEGSYGQVYHAHPHIMLKFQPPSSAIREFYILTRLKDPTPHSSHLQEVHQLIYHHKRCLIVGELYSAPTLVDYANQHQYLNESTIALLIHQLLTTILHLHTNNIIHNDIKLDNLLIHPTTPPHLRLIDFGRAIDLSHFPPSTQFLPTPTITTTSCHRLSPTQQDLHLPWRYHEDYFGLANTIYSLLTYSPLLNFTQHPPPPSLTTPSLTSSNPTFSPNPPLQPRHHLPPSSLKFWSTLIHQLINPDQHPQLHITLHQITLPQLYKLTHSKKL